MMKLLVLIKTSVLKMPGVWPTLFPLLLISFGVLLSLLIFALVVEKLILRRYLTNRVPVDPQLLAGLQRSTVRAAQASGALPPKVWVYSDPLPLALAVRPLGGRGSLVMSQGFLSMANERELEWFLKKSIESLRAKGSLRDSCFWFLLLLAMQILPKVWVEFFMSRSRPGVLSGNLSPSGAILLWALAPFLTFLLEKSRSRILFPFAMSEQGNRNYWLASESESSKAVAIGLSEKQSLASLLAGGVRRLELRLLLPNG